MRPVGRAFNMYQVGYAELAVRCLVLLQVRTYVNAQSTSTRRGGGGVRRQGCCENGT